MCSVWQMERDQSLQTQEMQDFLQQVQQNLQKIEEIQQENEELKQQLQQAEQQLQQACLVKVQLEMQVLLKLYMRQIELKSLLKLELTQSQLKEIQRFLENRCRKYNSWSRRLSRSSNSCSWSSSTNNSRCSQVMTTTLPFCIIYSSLHCGTNKPVQYKDTVWTWSWFTQHSF